MDNLGVHRSTLVKDTMNELGIRYIFNVPYSPDFQGVESVFSKVKNIVKRKKLNDIVNKKKTQIENIIKYAFA